MPRPPADGEMTTQKGRVVYDRKPKFFRLKDLLRIGSKINLRFWLIPGKEWLGFLSRTTEFRVNELEYEPAESGSGSFQIKAETGAGADPGGVELSVGVVFLNKDEWEAENG